MYDLELCKLCKRRPKANRASKYCFNCKDRIMSSSPSNRYLTIHHVQTK